MQDVDTKLKKILIVEDNKDMRMMYKIFFSGYEDKYSIDIEDKGIVALERLRKKDYDLIILDIIMQPMSGDTFFVQVRSYEKTKTVPVLVISVLNPDTLSYLRRINHIEFLQKPVTEEQLLSKIDEIFRF